ncbi:hypothetical protein MBLNU13_g08368t3 [Cladosporium sp. NU13]
MPPASVKVLGACYPSARSLARSLTLASTPARLQSLRHSRNQDTISKPTPPPQYPLKQSKMSGQPANQAPALNGVLVTFLVIVGAGFAVLICFAVSHRFMTARQRDSAGESGVDGQVSDLSQAAYMSQVRDRNRQDLLHKYGWKYELRPVAQDIESRAGSQSHY